MELIRIRRATILHQGLERQLEIRECPGIEQVAQLLLAKQFAQQVTVERQRACPPFGHGRIAVVHVGRDVVEHQRAREGRRLDGLDALDGDLAAGDAGEQLAQRRQVEDVAQALPVGLDEDREAAIAARHLQQVGRPLTLLPQRRSRSRASSWQEQRPRRVLAEARREQRRRANLRHDEVLDLLRIGEEKRVDATDLAFGQSDRNAVVGPDRLDLEAKPLVDSCFERQRPRRVDAGTEAGSRW